MQDQVTVALCVPSAKETWRAKMAVCFSDLRMYSASKGIQSIAMSLPCSAITAARNILVLTALRANATHIMWIDDDMKFPADGLVKLLSHDKDAVGAFYNRKLPPYKTAGHLLDSKDGDLINGGLHRADQMPSGFFLVKRHVYETVKAPWYFESHDAGKASETDPFGTVGEDTNFTLSCIKSGFDVWCDVDLSYYMIHLGEAEIPCRRPYPPTSPQLD